MNKEIEEILNYMKQYVENKYEHDSEPMLNYKDLQIVLSYIEQLEKENQQLKKQKDDGIKYIHKELDRFDCEGSMSISMRISYFKEDLLRMLGEIDG